MNLNKFLVLAFCFIASCKTNEDILQSAILTKDATQIELTSAKLHGEISNEGIFEVTARGFYLSEKNTSPTANDIQIQSGQGKGSFSSFVDGLRANTVYYFVSYYIDNKALILGNTKSFKTQFYNLANANSEPPLNIGYNHAQFIGEVSNEGGGSVSECGFVYSKNNSVPTILDIKLPTSKGIGKFSIWINNLVDNTNYFVRTYAINEKGITYGDISNFRTREVKTVISRTGRIWLDRNLGAEQVAVSMNDTKAYGYYYQWGRLTDGHQTRNSKTTNNRTEFDIPNHNLFITAEPNSQLDWRIPINPNLWQVVTGTNNICPTGFRIPTSSEWRKEVESWISTNSEGAMSSPLKLPSGGMRTFDGSFDFPGWGFYHSSTITSNRTNILMTNTSDKYLAANIGISNTLLGMSVRCIKD